MINRTKVYQKYSGHCAYCGKNIEITEMQVDHMKSKKHGGNDNTAERRFFTIKLKSDESTIFSKEMTPTETGTNAYNAWLEEECDSKILTDKEKAYLSAVIKPFREEVKNIKKANSCNNIDQLILFEVRDRRCSLPLFKKETLYKGMECNKEYTLEELRL